LKKKVVTSVELVLQIFYVENILARKSRYIILLTFQIRITGILTIIPLY